MRAAHARRAEECEMVRRGLTEALQLLRKPTGRPDLDRNEIQSRIIRASEFLRLNVH
jgi:hypothetical protein